MIQTKEELFLAELGINPKEEIELSYGAKIKITDLLKKYQAKQLILSGVSQRSEPLLAFLKCYNNGEVTNYGVNEVDDFLKHNS
jgi:hypothetical protein